MNGEGMNPPPKRIWPAAGHFEQVRIVLQDVPQLAHGPAGDLVLQHFACMHPHCCDGITIKCPPPATEVKCAMSLIHAHRKPVWWKGRASWKPQWEAWMIRIVFNSVHKCMARKTCPRDISNPKCLLVPFQLIHCTLPSDSIPSWVLDGWVIPTNAVFSVTKMPQKPMRKTPRHFPLMECASVWGWAKEYGDSTLTWYTTMRCK